MAGTPPRHHQRFVDADMTDAVTALVAVIDDLRPHVVVTYDPDGGYGHPDHIQTHRVTTAAVAAATWRVPKFYWTVFATSGVLEGLDAMADGPAGWIRLGFSSDEVPFGYPD